MKPCGYASKTRAGWHVKFKLGNRNMLLYATIEQVRELVLKKNGWIKTYRWSGGRLKAEGYLGWSKTGNVLILKNKAIWIIDPQELLEVATARRPFTKIYEGSPAS
jgi:hypothetical protein